MAIEIEASRAASIVSQPLFKSRPYFNLLSLWLRSSAWPARIMISFSSRLPLSRSLINLNSSNSSTNSWQPHKMYTFLSLHLSLSFASHSSYHMTMHNSFLLSFYLLITRASSLSAVHYTNFHLIFRKFTPFATEMKYFVPLWLTNIRLLRLMNTRPSKKRKPSRKMDYSKYDFTFIFYPIFSPFLLRRLEFQENPLNFLA